MKKSNYIVEFILKIIIVLIICITIIAAYGLFQIKILKKDYSNIFGYSIFQIETGSMSGTIEIGDLIIVKITKDVKEQDIITFKQDEHIITHRLVEKNNNIVTTKGDSNNTKDAPMDIDNVIGKVIKIIPNIATWEKVLTDRKVYIPLIITIILFGITFSYEDIKKEENNVK